MANLPVTGERCRVLPAEAAIAGSAIATGMNAKGVQLPVTVNSDAPT